MSQIQKKKQETYWYDYIYDKNDPKFLQYSCDFSDELKCYLTDQPNFNTIIRKILLGPLAFCYILTLYIWPLSELVSMLSNWALHVQTYSLILCIQSSRMPTFSVDRRQQAKHHLFYCLSAMIHMVVVSIYWTMIHPKTI